MLSGSLKQRLPENIRLFWLQQVWYRFIALPVTYCLHGLIASQFKNSMAVYGKAIWRLLYFQIGEPLG